MDLTWGLRWPQKAIRSLTSGLWEIRVFFSLRYWKAQECRISRCPGLWETLAWWISIFRIFHEWCVPSREACHSQTLPQLQHSSPSRAMSPRSGFCQNHENVGCGKWLHGFWCCPHHKQGLVLAFRPCKGLWCVTYRHMQGNHRSKPVE